MVVVDVAEGDDVFAGDGAEMGFASAPRADERNVEFVAGGIGAENFCARQNECGSAKGGGGFEEFASFHKLFLLKRRASLLVDMPRVRDSFWGINSKRGLSLDR